MADTDILLVLLAVAMGASFLTFFSGFGLGTILLPVFSIFYSIELAMIMTAIVHFANNLFKTGLTFRHIDKPVLFRFGTTSILGAIAGAWVFSQMGNDSLNYFRIGQVSFTMNWTGIVIGSFLLIFSFIELLPARKNLQFKPEYLSAGGFVSGFFGGLSGHQGALRTAFLSRSNLSKESFIATGIIIACLVDIIRIPVYAQDLRTSWDWENTQVISAVAVGIIGAVLGAITGNRFLKKSSYTFVRSVVGVFLLLMGVLMIMGIRW